MNDPADGQQPGVPLKRKRIRIPKSCIPCLKGKRACDRERPACGRCARSGQPSECVYDARLEAKAASAGGRKVKALKRSESSADGSDDDDGPDHRQADDEVESLRASLAAARRETRQLQDALRTQQYTHAQSIPPQYQSRAAYPSQANSNGAAMAGPSGDPMSMSSRKRAMSRHNDFDAVSGLQMLAEMAGPAAGRPSSASSQPDHSRAAAASSAAFYDRSKMSSIASVLNWPDENARNQAGSRSSNASASRMPGRSPSSRASVDGPGANLSVGLGGPHASSSEPALSPSSDTRSHISSSTSTLQSPGNAALANPTAKDGTSPVNRNGVPIYYGESASGNVVIRQVKDEHTATERSSSLAQPFHARSHAGSVDASGVSHVGGEGHANAVKRDLQVAFNRLLDPSQDAFPFATIWSSGDGFIDEVLPFFPTPDEFDAICQSFVRHFSAMCPALTVPSAIEHAREFSRLPREQQVAVPLPWLAVFLMICAMGINCDLENTILSSNRHGRHRQIDALLGGAERSKASSAASSPAPHATDGSDATRSSAGTALNRVAASPGLFSDVYLSATYQALRLSSFLSSPTLQTIHSQLLIGSYLLNTERASSFWPLLGSVARQAQSIGLHVDPDLIRSDWDPVEKDIRRRLWWAIVHQDVILSGIFGRPLGITRFNTRFPASLGTTSRNFAALQCELSQFARTYLDENQDQSWSQQQINEFTDRVQTWYADIPRQYRIDSGGIVDPIGSRGEAEAIRNYQTAGMDLNIKGLMEVHQSCNLAIEVSYVLLSLHRSNLLCNNDKAVEVKIGDGEETRSVPKRCSSAALSSHSLGSTTEPDETTSFTSQKGGGDRVNETSLRACARHLREITKAQQIMTELLGRARAAMFWKVSYYTYQAAVVGAYIIFLRPNGECAADALEDLGRLADIFDRMPDRWTGLKMAKGGLRVLHKLATAARENPKAASLARSAQANQPTLALTPLPMMTEFDPFGGGAGVGGVGGFSGLFGSGANTPTAATTPSFYGHGNSGALAQSAIPSRLLQTQQQQQQMQASFQQGVPTPFMLPIYHHNSPGPVRSTTPGPFGASAAHGNSHAVPSQHPEANHYRGSPFSLDHFLGGDGPPQPQGSPGWARAGGPNTSTAVASGPGYGVMDDSAAKGSSRAGAAGPSMAAMPNSGAFTGSAAASSQPAPAHVAPATGAGMSFSQAAPFPGGMVSGSSGDEHDMMMANAAAAAGGSGLGGVGLVPGSMGAPVNPNPKDLANYWSDYFSLQLDWDRLAALT